MHAMGLAGQDGDVGFAIPVEVVPHGHDIRLQKRIDQIVVTEVLSHRGGRQTLGLLQGSPVPHMVENRLLQRQE